MAVKKDSPAAEAAEKKETNMEKRKAADSCTGATKADGGKETVQMVYIGPSLPRGQLKSNTVFKGTKESILENVNEITEKIPMLVNMFVPVEQLAAMKQKVQADGSIYHKYYKDIASVAEGITKEEG